jgi:hypothetical protein
MATVSRSDAGAFHHARLLGRPNLFSGGKEGRWGKEGRRAGGILVLAVCRTDCSRFNFLLPRCPPAGE